MDFHLPPSITAIASILALLVFLYHLLRNHGDKKRVAPEAAGAWPLIGHLRLLGGPELPHKVLGSLADKYGPIFTIRLGVHRALVVSNSEIAKQCLNTNDVAFSNRPSSIATEHLTYNYAMFGFSPYGPYWRELRKITTLELLSNRHLSMLRQVNESEVKSSIKDIYTKLSMNKNSDGKVLVELKRWFGDMTLNMIFRIIAGKHFSGGSNDKSVEECRQALRQFFEHMGMFILGDTIPMLRWLDLGGQEKAMKKTAKKLDSIMQEWLEEHKEKRRVSGEVKKKEKDFMDVMISILDEATFEATKYDPDTVNKATCLSLTLGGTDTTTMTLIWAVALLLNNTYALKKAQDELDIHVGRDRQVNESDIKNLVYIQAIVKETLRLYPATQIIPLRLTREDCNVGEYHVPAGTQLFVNLWKIHRNSRAWPNPEEFRPERFLTTHKDVDMRGQHFDLMPFGSGRRVCPGISFALEVVHFTLASFLHVFEVATPSDQLVDMTQTLGFTNVKATPLEVILTPHLPSQLYE